MTSLLLCAMLAAGAAPVPADHIAPAPRLVKPDITFIYTEWLPGGLDAPRRARLWNLGFRAGRMLLPEQIWEGEENFLCGGFGRLQIVAGRLLVTNQGGVIDLGEKKVLSSERDGQVERVDEANVTYRIESNSRPEGLFTFEYATRTVTRIAAPPVPRPWYDKLQSSRALSPDRKKAIRWENGEELILYREGEKPKSLGKGFKMKEDLKVVFSRSLDLMYFPVAWVGNDRFLTQRDHGKLVLVDLEGKTTDVVTIKDAPEITSPSFRTDRSGAIFYYLEGEYYRIDLAKKTAVKSEWQSLGHGFEASWKRDESLGYKFRHNGKDIGQFHAWAEVSPTAPGYLALSISERKELMFHAPRSIAVWSAATGEWTTRKHNWLTPMALVGWIK